MNGLNSIKAALGTKRAYRAAMAAAVLLICFLSFFRLDVDSCEWDEARHGISAYEMIKRNDYLVTTYEYEPDYWNLKPMLSEYLIVLGYRLFGYNMWGLRFFSAFLWVALMGLYSRFAGKKYGKAAALLVLLLGSCTYRMNMWHGIRVGNADMLHVFLSGVSMLALLEYDGQKPGWLYAACLCFSLDFLAKSFHAGVLALEIIVFVLLYDRALLKKPLRVGICLFCALAPILLWGGLRYARDGMTFLQSMYTVDVNARGTTVIENRNGGVLFYLWRMFADTLCLGAGLAFSANCALRKENPLRDRHTTVMLLYIVLPIFLYTLAVSKLTWYTYTMYPAFILLAARCLPLLARAGSEKKRKAALLLCTLLLLSAFVINLSSVLTVKSDAKKDELMLSGQALSAYRGSGVYGFSRDDVGQIEALMLEWQGDLVPKRGAREAWQRDAAGLMLVEKKDFSSLGEWNVPFEYVFHGEMYAIVRHSH